MHNGPTWSNAADNVIDSGPPGTHGITRFDPCGGAIPAAVPQLLDEQLRFVHFGFLFGIPCEVENLDRRTTVVSYDSPIGSLGNKNVKRILSLSRSFVSGGTGLQADQHCLEYFVLLSRFLVGYKSYPLDSFRMLSERVGGCSKTTVLLKLWFQHQNYERCAAEKLLAFVNGHRRGMVSDCHKSIQDLPCDLDSWLPSHPRAKALRFCFGTALHPPRCPNFTFKA